MIRNLASLAAFAGVALLASTVAQAQYVTYYSPVAAPSVVVHHPVVAPTVVYRPAVPSVSYSYSVGRPVYSAPVVAPVAVARTRYRPFWGGAVTRVRYRPRVVGWYGY